MIKICHADGTEERRDSVTFAQLRELVGGYVEVVGLPDGSVMAANEDGFALDLPTNQCARVELAGRCHGREVQELKGVVVFADKRKELGL